MKAYLEIPQSVSLSGIGEVKIKTRFEIFNFYLARNFNFTCILDGKGTRNLWNDGQQIVSDHFIHLINVEVKSGLKLIQNSALEHDTVPILCNEC